MSTNRRNFLKLSATAGAAFAMAPSSIYGKELQKTTMPVRTLGRTGYKVPILSMGVMNANNPAVVKNAYESGIVHFDTANGYQNGRNETMLGTFFADKPRDSYIIATKVKRPQGDDVAQKFRESFETSMSRLKMDYVDILYYHDVTSAEAATLKPIVDTMLALKKEGKVKYLGISTHSNEPEVIDAAIKNGAYDVILTTYHFNIKALAELDAAIDRAVKAGLGIVAMKAVAGYFSDRGPNQKINPKAGLKWAWQNPNIHTIIPGFVSFDQLDECLAAAANIQMTDEEKKFITASADQPLLYCQGCRICEGQCSKHLPIPEMMRAYMYNYGYRQSQLAKSVISELQLSDNPCGDCSECKVKCTNGFQIVAKIKDIHRLKYVPDDFLV